MDPWRTPKGIGSAHLADQVSKFLRDPRPAAPGARFPPPERSEPSAMPSDDRFRANQGHRIQCVGDDPIDPHQPPTVPIREARSLGTMASGDVQLMPEQEVLGRNLRP
jgi:hypothetical protein